MSLSNSNTENEDNEVVNKPAKNHKWKPYQMIFTLCIFLLVQFPQIALSWINLLETPLLQSIYTAIEIVLKTSAK